jgi:hypothetical protein|tara:strand:- start:389 stop:589 length:201 start_codon:yes stop_codon:yes gene_type:complete
MYAHLPESPVKKIFDCPKCGKVSIYFYDSTHDRSYTPQEWESIMTEGNEALYRILQTVRENPLFFG